MVDANILNRIYNIYNSCTLQEREYLRQILQELSDTGDSQTYNDIWLADYKEIPVDIDTFVVSNRYMGLTNQQGKTVYPFWRKTMREIFNAGNTYEEVVLTGATRIGKTSTAVLCAIYMLYRLMCLRDPQKYFGKKDISKFSILFFNITKDLAKGVAYREFNDSLAMSPWFNDHGTFSKSERDFYYIPEGGKIVIDYGSDAAHGLGKQVFCVVGNTRVITTHGIVAIADLVNNNTAKIFTYAYFENRAYFDIPISIECTSYVYETLRITFNNGIILEGTPEHSVLLANGTYTTLSALTLNSELIVVNNFGDSGKVTPIKIDTIHYTSPIPVYDVIDMPNTHNFIIDGGLVLHNCGIMDEANFSKTGVKDVSKAKQHMQDLYNTISARIQGTFRMGGSVYGKLFAVSSKRSDSDFMEVYVEKQKSSGAGEHLYIADAPQWEVMPASMFSNKKFTVAVGDRHRRGFVVDDAETEELQAQKEHELKLQGYKLIYPPLDMRPKFVADFDIALRDLAGISIAGSLSFITQEAIDNCKGNRQNAFMNDILEIGNKDTLTIEEFFHEEYVPQNLKIQPMCIHLDLSLNTDRTGISGVVVSGRKDIVGEDGKTMSQPTFAHIFSIALEAPRGDKIPYAKITSFICWLRRIGFNIQKISRDQFQSEYMAQLLEAEGFSVDKISLDRTPDGYTASRSIMLEQRVDMVPCKLLEDEMVHLQRDSITGKIDHTLGNCLVGDTKVRLTDGRDLTILELIEEQKYQQNFVYSINEATYKIEKKPILSVHKTKFVTELIKIILDNGDSFICTPEHPILSVSGNYVLAQDCMVGDFLFPYTYCARIISIVRMHYAPCYVYDLTIKDNPNFLLSCGVFVHNSKDVSDSFAGALWEATMTNPGVAVPVRTVSNVISSINGGRASPANGVPNIISHINRMRRR